MEEELHQIIEQHLNRCSPINTPYVCAMSKSAESKQSLIADIQKLVLNGNTVGGAIIEIEKAYNPELID